MKLALCAVLALMVGIQVAFAAEEGEMSEMQGPQLFVAVLELAVDPENPEHHALLAEHVDYLGGLFAAGSLVLGGPFTDTSNQGMLLLRTDSLEEAQALVEGDPTMAAGAMTVIWIRPFWDAFNAHEGRGFSSEDLEAMHSAGEPAEVATEE